ncbi:lipopolysaccharide biosynthesis protein [Aeromonas veronii]
MLKTIGKQLGYGLIAQIITFLITPVITRLYSPNDFGTFNNIVLWAGFILPIIALSLPTAIVLQKSNALVVRASRACFLLSGVMFLIILIFASLLSYYPHLDIMHHVFYALLLAAILNANDIFSYTLIRYGKLRTRGLLLLIQAVIAGVLKIILGLKFPTYSILVISTVLGYIFCFLIYYKDAVIITTKFRFKDVQFFIKKHKEIVIFRMPQNLITAANQLIPILFVTYYFGAVFAGVYALSRTVIILPFNVLGRAVQDVLYPRYMRLILNKKNISNEICKITLLSLILSVLPGVILWEYGEYLFKVIFGEVWAESGMLAFWVLVPNVIMFSNKALLVLTSIFKIEKYLLINSMALLFINCLCYFIMPRFGWDELDTVIYGNILSVLPHFVLSYICLREVYIYEKKCSFIRGI